MSAADRARSITATGKPPIMTTGTSHRDLSVEPK